MPLGAFRLNSIARPSGPNVTGWNAWTGAEDGNVLTWQDTTYGVGGIHADLATPNKILLITSGNNNVANQNRLYEITWDSNYNLTRTFKDYINQPNYRSGGNYFGANLLTKFYVQRTHENASQNGYVFIQQTQEGTGGGSQRMEYMTYSTVGSTNTITKKFIGAGVMNGAYYAARQIPSYAEDSTYFYVLITAGGGGGSNNTNYITSFRVNKSTGQLDGAYDQTNNDGRGREDDGRRHPILMNATKNTSGVSDPLILTYQGEVQNAGTTGVEFNALAITSYPSSTKTFTGNVVEMPDPVYNISWHNHYNFDKPGYQLYAIHAANPVMYFNLVKADENGTSSPTISFSNQRVELNYLTGSFPTYQNYVTSLGDEQGLVFFLQQNGNTMDVKMSALNVDYSTMTLEKEVEAFSIIDPITAGDAYDICTVRIDDDTHFVAWSDLSDNVFAKIIRKA